MRRLRPSGRGIATFALGLAVGLAGAFGWANARRPSPLTADLPGEWQAASAQFDARVKARFPVGTPVGRLADDLEAQGFEPSWGGPPGEYAAHRDESDFVCRIAARIYWRARDRRIAAIRGVYREEGCL